MADARPFIFATPRIVLDNGEVVHPSPPSAYPGIPFGELAQADPPPRYATTPYPDLTFFMDAYTNTYATVNNNNNNNNGFLAFLQSSTHPQASLARAQFQEFTATTTTTTPQ